MRNRLFLISIARILALIMVIIIILGDNGIMALHGAIATYPGGLPRLYVEGNSIRSEAGSFFLVGCNVRGQAYNPKTDIRYDDWYTDRYLDAENIKSYGFNVIRLITYWECIETSQSPSEFTYDDNYIEKIRQTVEAYNQNNIYVIIDLHQHGSTNELSRFIPTLGSDSDFADEFYSDASPTSAREHLKRLWLRLSETFKDYPEVAGYDICNEPHRSSGSLSYQQIADLWLDIADYVIAGLRANGDNHIIFTNFAPWARYTAFMSRKLNDSNVVYAPHFYYGINESSLTVSNNNYDWLKQQFDAYVNAKMSEFNVPFVMEEQGFGSRQINEGDASDIWLKNALTIHKTSPLMQGWLWWCYIAYGGKMQGGGWQNTLIEHFADKWQTTLIAQLIINGTSTNRCQLTIVVSPSEGGSTSHSLGNYMCDMGSSVTVSETPVEGYEFDHWDLDGLSVGSNSSYTVVMNAPHTLTAVFRVAQTVPDFSLSISVPTILQVENITQDSIGKISLQIAHANPSSSHYVDLVEVDVNGQVIQFPQQPQNSDPFTVELDLGQVQGTPNVRARAHCILHGWSDWSNQVPLPEFSATAMAVFIVMGVSLFMIRKTKIRRLETFHGNHFE